MGTTQYAGRKDMGSRRTVMCARCGSQDIKIQIVNTVKLKNAHHGILWWVLVGWYWVFIKWIFLTIPALIFAIFVPKKQKAVNIQKTMAVCQKCGYSWQV